MDVDDVLKELVERKTRMQSYSPFNLDATVSELNSDYSRALAASARARDLKRELRNGDVTHDLDEISNNVSIRMQKLLDHSKEESSASISKFDEMMARLKSTAAAHKASIKSGNTDLLGESTRGNETESKGQLSNQPVEEKDQQNLSIEKYGAKGQSEEVAKIAEGLEASTLLEESKGQLNIESSRPGSSSIDT